MNLSNRPGLSRKKWKMVQTYLSFDFNWLVTTLNSKFQTHLVSNAKYCNWRRCLSILC